MSTAPPNSLVALWGRTRDALKAAGVASPVLDARMLLEAAAGVARLDIVTDPYRLVADDAVMRLNALAARRAAREPLAYILGRKAFWSLEFAVSPAVLSPRPETETLVEAALAALAPDRPARVLDLGVGSGAVLLAVLNERPLASGLGVDASAGALAVARDNAAALGLAARAQFVLGDWGAGIEGPFDLVVSNPPYIASGEIDGLAPEVARHEPRLALDGGPDGLAAYRRIAAGLKGLLAPRTDEHGDGHGSGTGGRFALEVGRGQADDVTAILRDAGLAPDTIRPDLAGIGRVVAGGL